ncbi:MAG: adenylate/guanylate cyclase domain-containing protein, partial [Baekduiaceae bacterium]
MDTATASHAFLFADLVGYTALTAAHGDERAADVATRFHTEVRRLLPAGAGPAEVKTLGDGLMIRLTDPVDAVRLGVAITEAVDDLTDVPAVRVGIHTGPAVHRNGDWYGTTVNVASRLCDAAADGEVLVSEDTAAAAGRPVGIAFGAPELHTLKNLDAPIPARPAQLAAPAASPPRARAALARLR